MVKVQEEEGASGEIRDIGEKDMAERWRSQGEKCKEEDREVKERTEGTHREERGAEATAWRAGPCENRDVLNLC